MEKANRGYTVIELLVVIALIGMLAAIAWPRINIFMGVTRVRMAAGEVAGALAEARLSAIKHSSRVALRFDTASDGDVTMTIYRDGDGDGVLKRDIDRGVDKTLKEQRRLANFDDRIHFGFLYGEAPTEIGRPGRRIKRLSDPIRFNRSDMASFSSLGTATPGTIYLTDGFNSLVAVRVNHQSGLISVWTYNKETERWRGGG